MEGRITNCCWFLMLLLSSGLHLNYAEKCLVEEKYECEEDCNCPNKSLLRNFLSYFLENFEEIQCEKCKAICTKENQIECVHGECDTDKSGCVCHGCWTGKSCFNYVNTYKPKFTKKPYEAVLDDGMNVGDRILKVSATDPDVENCTDISDCPCGRIKYSITKGNEQELFHINSENGEITLKRKLVGENRPEPFVLHVTAENTGNDNHGSRNFVIVSISPAAKERSRRSTHHIVRRSVPAYTKLIIKYFGTTSNETFFAVGARIEFNLTIAQNQTTTPEQLSAVTLGLASDNLEIDKDSFTFDGTTTSPVTSLSLYQVSISLSDPISSTGEITIIFTGTVKASVVPVAPLQVAFTMNATGDSSGSLTFGPEDSIILYTTYPLITFSSNITGDIRIETYLGFSVNITIPDQSFPLQIEFSTTVNDVEFLSIESVTLVSVSSSVTLEHSSPSPVEYTSIANDITSRVSMNFGNVQASNPDQTKNLIQLKFSVKVDDHYQLENQSEHWIGAGANTGEEALIVAQYKVIVFKDEAYLHAEVNTVEATAPTQYYIGDTLTVNFEIFHGNYSYGTAKNVKLIFVFSNYTSLFGSVNANGEGISCVSSTYNGQVTNECSLTTVDYPSGKVVSGFVKVTVSSNMAPLADLTPSMRVEYKDEDLTLRPVVQYTPSPGYQGGAPVFNLTANCTDRILKIGQLLPVRLDILINKVALQGEIQLFLTVANNETIAPWVNHSLTVVSIGSNLNAPGASTPLVTEASVKNVNGPYHDRATINVGEIKNTLTSPSAMANDEDNSLALTFDVVLDDNDNIVNGTTYWVGVGVKSGFLVWIAQLAFIACIPDVRRPSLQFSVTRNDTAVSLLQGDTIRYEFAISHKEGSSAHAHDVELLLMLPPYTPRIFESYSDNIQYSEPERNILAQITKLDFTSKTVLNVTLQMDPSKTLEKGKHFAVVIVALKYKDARTNEIIYNPMESLSAHFYTEPTTSSSASGILPEFYQRGYIVENSTEKSEMYFCQISKKLSNPSCFWTITKGEEWRAVDELVSSIIGIDNVNNAVYGIGNNKMSYMRFSPAYKSWVSISTATWQKAQGTLTTTRSQVVVVEESHENEGDPEPEKVFQVHKGEKWGANKRGMLYYTQESQWQKKAAWSDCD